MRAEANLRDKKFKRQLEGRIIRSWLMNQKSGGGRENDDSKRIFCALSIQVGLMGQVVVPLMEQANRGRS